VVLALRLWRAFCLLSFRKKHDKAEPRELAGEPNTGSVGIFLFWHKGTTANIKKDRELPMRKAEEQQKT